jgi:hypothetical protein
VLDMAPLIMVALPTVSSSFSTCGCFIRVGRSSYRTISLLSLSSLWMAPKCEWLSLLRMAGLRVEGPSRARKGGPNQPPEWARPAGLGRPAQVHPGPVRSPLRSRGSSCIYALCSLHLHNFDDVILASKMEVLLA